MSDYAGRRSRTASRSAPATARGDATAGKRTLTEQLPAAPQGAPVQRSVTASAGAGATLTRARPTVDDLFGGQLPLRGAPRAAEDDTAAIHTSAQRGIATSGSPLPHAATIQRAFGRHDISGIQAHTGAEATASAREMGAEAYATGAHVVLGGGTDLHTVAHEAAHVVQQRAGVHLKGGVGKVGDAYEQHADAVADAVVQGRSAEDLLSQPPGEPAHAVAAAGGARTSPASGPVQRIARDVYRGGAELEYRDGNAQLEFGNLPTTPEANEAAIKKLIRKGLKGIPIAAIGAEDKTQLTGANWALTVETNAGTVLDEDNRISVVLELILGGPTGSTLAQLEGAADEAAAAVESLATKKPLEFEGAGNRIRDAVIRKNHKVGQAQADIAKQEFDEPVYGDEHPLSQEWSGLTVTGVWTRGSAVPHDSPWGLQVTLGVPLADLAKAGAALKASGLTDTSKAQPGGDDVTWSAWDILDRMHKTEPLTQDPINEQDLATMYNEAHGEFDWQSEEHNQLLELLKAQYLAEQQTNLHAALETQVKLGSEDNAAPSIAALDGLAKVLAAYVRGRNGGTAQGPKHTMKFVNKNPLPDVIAGAASNMGDGGWYERLRDACVDLVLSQDGGTDVYRWEDHELTLADWGAEMKHGNVDLVAKYDAAYRSSQIGGLSSLNDVSQEPGEFGTAPIIEFRDLGGKKPSEMRAVFAEIIAKIEGH